MTITSTACRHLRDEEAATACLRGIADAAIQAQTDLLDRAAALGESDPACAALMKAALAASQIRATAERVRRELSRALGGRGV